MLFTVCLLYVIIRRRGVVAMYTHIPSRFMLLSYAKHQLMGTFIAKYVIVWRSFIPKPTLTDMFGHIPAMR